MTFDDGFLSESKRIQFIAERDGMDAAREFADRVLDAYHAGVSMKPGGKKIVNRVMSTIGRQHTLGSICFLEQFVDLND